MLSKKRRQNISSKKENLGDSRGVPRPSDAPFSIIPTLNMCDTAVERTYLRDVPSTRREHRRRHVAGHKALHDISSHFGRLLKFFMRSLKSSHFPVMEDSVPVETDFSTKPAEQLSRGLLTYGGVLGVMYSRNRHYSSG